VGKRLLALALTLFGYILDVILLEIAFGELALVPK